MESGFRRTLLVGLCILAQGCAGPPPCPIGAGSPANVVYVVAHGWHVDLGIPAPSLRGPMAGFRRVFPGMAVLMAGFGRRSFMMAPVVGLDDLLVGPFPGRGALLLAGLTAAPDRAYGDGTLAVLRLAPGGAERLSDFVWNSLATERGRPVRIGSDFPGSVFYAARIGYSGFYTCNSWAADALHAAGLAAGAGGVVFAGQVMGRASARSGGACAIGSRR